MRDVNAQKIWRYGLTICLIAFLATLFLSVYTNASDNDTPEKKSLFLSDRHKKAGVDCSGCHGTDAQQKAPQMGVCLGCHGGSYEAIAKALEKTEPNPHDSHEGALDCHACHHGHKASENYCSRCHTFNYRVP
jgi:uncharacterized paraquat-inducible protein A